MYILVLTTKEITFRDIVQRWIQAVGMAFIIANFTEEQM